MDRMLRVQSDCDILALSPQQLVPALYARVLDHLDSALAAIEAGDVDARCHHLERALAIVVELRAMLDMERGGEVAPRLAALYSYFAGELVAAGWSLDVALLRRIVDMIAGLYDSWEQAARLTGSSGGSVAVERAVQTSSFS